MRAEDNNTLVNYIIGYGVSPLQGAVYRRLPFALGADLRTREAVEEEAGLRLIYLTLHCCRRPFPSRAERSDGWAILSGSSVILTR